MNFDIDLDRQVLQPGDELVGWVTMDDPEVRSVDVVFQGEEILGANDVLRRYILPVVDEKQSVAVKGGLNRHEFRFVVPDDAPPTYASQDMRCEYSVKAIVKQHFWRRAKIQRMHVTILPTTQHEDLRALPAELEVDHPDLRLIARLDQTIVLTGESVSGTLHLDRKNDAAELPMKLSFRLAAIEESTEKYFPHREILSLDTHDVDVDQDMTLPFIGDFEFPIDSRAEPSGTWNTFKVHYGFRVVLIDHTGKDYRRSTFVRVLRDLQLRRDYPASLTVEPEAPSGF